MLTDVRAGLLSDVISSSLLKCSSTSYARGAWTLLEALTSEAQIYLSTQQSIDIATLATSSWEALRESSIDKSFSNNTAIFRDGEERTELICLALNTLTSLSTRFDEEGRLNHKNALVADLLTFILPPATVSACLHLLEAISASKEDILIQCDLVLTRSHEILLSYLNRMNTATLQTDEEEQLEAQAGSALFTLGEISMLGFSVEEDESKFRMAANNFRKLLITDDPQNYLFILPSDLLSSLRIYMLNELPNAYMVKSVPSELRAFAFLSMGKLCMRNKALAKEQLNVLLRELSAVPAAENDDANQHAVRANVIVVLGDLCVRYTHLVEGYIGKLASGLQASNCILVKQNSLIVLCQLLTQDYIKLRGILLFRFFACTADENV